MARIVARLLQPMGGRIMAVDPSVTYSDIPATTESLTIPTSYGDVKVTVYLPAEPKNAPIHVNFHGSGYILRFPEQDDALCRYLAHHVGAVVINVDYDVAPQHRYPAAPREGYEVYTWLRAHAGARGWDADRISVGGQSAGGVISNGIVRLALADGVPLPRALAMVYPPLVVAEDAIYPPNLAEKPVLAPGLVAIFNAAYFDDSASRGELLASPAAAQHLIDLPAFPPTLIINAAQDMLRDDAERYAGALREAGTEVTFWTAPDADHNFTLHGPRVVVDHAFGLIAEHVRRSL